MKLLKVNRKLLSRTRNRVVAIILVVTLFGTTALAGFGMASRVMISTDPQAGNAAHNYLIANTDYVNADGMKRIGEYIRSLGSQKTLDDYYRQAGVQIAHEEYREALGSIQKCIQLYAGESQELYADLWLKKGCLHMMLGEFSLALASLNRVTALDATIASAYLVKAQVYARLDNLVKMTEALNSYIALVPGDKDILSLLSELRQPKKEVKPIAVRDTSNLTSPVTTVETEFLTGLYAMQAADYESAEQALTRALSLDSKYGKINYYRGVCRLALADYEGAVSDFTASIENEDMVHSSYYNRGIAGILADKYESGMEDIRYAAQNDEDPSVKSQAENFLSQANAAQTEARLTENLLKAEACAEQKDITGMCENLEAYLAEVPEDAGIREVLAQARFANEEYGEALKQYEILLETESTAQLEYLYGLSALQLSDFTLAEAALGRSVIADDSCDGVYYYRGICRLSLEDYKGAAEDFTVSIERDSMVHSSYFNRGVSLLMKEDIKQGMADIKYAAKINEDPEVKEQAKQLLKELESIR